MITHRLTGDTTGHITCPQNIGVSLVGLDDVVVTVTPPCGISVNLNVITQQYILDDLT